MPLVQPHQLLQDDEHFGPNEVGITHPLNKSHVRVRDDGRIEISAGGVGIVLDAENRTIALVADKIKFLTHDQGLQWNKYSFNPQAYRFGQPTLVTTTSADVYDGIEAYFK